MLKPLVMKPPILLVLTVALLGAACSRTSRETIVLSAYETSALISTNATPGYVCYNKAQLNEGLAAFELEQSVRAKLESVNFEEHLVCLIRDAEVIEVIGRGGLGFIRVTDQSTNGVGVAIINRHANRFYQFHKSK